MIKNTSINREKNLTYLRINFHNPQNAAASKDVIMPPMIGRKAVYIKELTLKSDNGKNLEHVNQKVKEAIRLLKQKDQQEVRPADAREEDQHLAHEELVKARNSKIPMLHDIIVRPAITGKKTIGVLECHANGFRFNSSRG